MQGTRKGKHIGQNDYYRIKELLKTRSPMELSQAGVCGYSTAYKIMNTTGYGDYRNKLREEREKFYNQRKSPTQIKKNVPPMGTGYTRSNPPHKPLDGTGNTDTVFGSPFRENVEHVPKEKPKNGPVVAVKQGTDQPEAIIDVKPGSTPASRPTPDKDPTILPFKQEVYDAYEARAHNARVTLNTNGVDSFKYVDANLLKTMRGRAPTQFGAACISGICSLARNGGTGREILDYIYKAGFGRKGTMDQVARTIAYNKEGLEEFKKAWKAGKETREKRIVELKLRGAKTAAANRWGEKAAVQQEIVRKAIEKKPEPVVVPAPSVSEKFEQFMSDPNEDKALLTAQPVIEKVYKDEIEERKHVVTAEHVKKAAENVALKQAEEVVKKREKNVKVIKIDGDKLDFDHVIAKAYEANNGKLKKKVKICRKHMGYDTVSFVGAQATVLALKLAGAIDLPWVWTFLPLYVLAGLLLLNCVLLGILTAVYYLDYVKEEERM